MWAARAAFFLNGFDGFRLDWFHNADAAARADAGADRDSQHMFGVESTVGIADEFFPGGGQARLKAIFRTSLCHPLAFFLHNSPKFGCLLLVVVEVLAEMELRVGLSLLLPASGAGLAWNSCPCGLCYDTPPE